MLLRMSTLFLRTLREDPAEAEVPSHRLLVRAGYVRRATPGGYTWLPLGIRVRDKITSVVRREMAAIGAQEVSFPSLLPRQVYETSGRWAEYGADIFRLRDRRGAEYLLGPTHEEMFALLVRDSYTSYRDFPVTLFQIGTKFRDERR
ncbi:MAG TPA: aminoacyl--tRNA ligase-related protein, partial [Micromonosporaceae bacterium]|nr:aminoacyl--tRNA ligase-related protein [Micromonosporaceae bacterium]